MAVCGVGRCAPRHRQDATVKHTEVGCHACSRSTKVAYTWPDEMVKHLEDRGWDVSHGAICCPEHVGIRVMARHQHGLVAAGSGHERTAQRY